MEQNSPTVAACAGRGPWQLSPLNLRDLLANEVFDYSPDAKAEAEQKKKRKSAKHTLAYACPKCDSLHRWEDDAEDCCQGPPEQAGSTGDYACLCPVCGSKNDGPADASDCCLWKDLDQATRHAIAGRVDAGSTWARELGVWPPTNVELSGHQRPARKDEK